MKVVYRMLLGLLGLMLSPLIVPGLIVYLLYILGDCLIRMMKEMDTIPPVRPPCADCCTDTVVAKWIGYGYYNCPICGRQLRA